MSKKIKKWQSYKDVKIGVYAIGADEPNEFIDRWLESMKGADYIWILITKKDNPNTTYFQEKQKDPRFANKLIVKEEDIKPWRFDVARNRSLEMVEADKVDALVCTDIDEILIDDFWDDYRKAVFERPDFERIYYKYAWSHYANGEPCKCFWYDKTHLPVGWKWEYPVHEALCFEEGKTFKDGCLWLDENKVYLHHYPDNTKSRGSYLGLLELRAQENPEDLNGMYYLAREYEFHQQYEKAHLTAFNLYTKISVQQRETYMLSSVCIMLGKYEDYLGMKTDALHWYNRSIQHKGAPREAYVRCAQKQVWSGDPDSAEKTLGLMEQYAYATQDWREEPWAWRLWKLNQIKADICMWRGDYKQAKKLMEEALKDIKENSDEGNARNEGFYDDLLFLENHLELSRK